MEKFGFSETVWNAAKAEAKATLVERAKLRGMMPYSDLVRAISSGSFTRLTIIQRSFRLRAM